MFDSNQHDRDTVRVFIKYDYYLRTDDVASVIKF